MFDLAWSEIALIGVVAIVVIGPKDLPEAIRGVARGIAKLRRMASEFQGQADELVREANLDEVRNSINDIRNFNIRDEIEKHVDKDGSIRKTFTEDPLKDSFTPPVYTPPPPVTEPPAAAMEGASATPGSASPAAPAFVPPAYAPAPMPAYAPPMPEPALPPVAAEPPAPPAMPAFVPPAEPAPADVAAPHTQKI